jgi:hypothetical protein
MSFVEGLKSLFVSSSQDLQNSSIAGATSPQDISIRKRLSQISPKRISTHSSDSGEDWDLSAASPIDVKPDSLTDLANQLDILHISQRLVVMGMPWKSRTEKRIHRNQIDHIATFIDLTYRNRYMIFNLSCNFSIFNF